MSPYGIVEIMRNAIFATIPKKLAQRGELVILPLEEYKAYLVWQKKREWEEKDTDQAIRIFKKEKAQGKLMSSNNFSDILART